jgi:asparagine synthase (glutamine-hydrolysing)
MMAGSLNWYWKCRQSNGMCGIVGVWKSDYDRDHLRRDLGNAVASLHHRGPDDSGTWLNESGLALGHTRLSILDLSPLGHQPMVSPDGRFAIVFNGEIYNFAELREQLRSLGHRFSGSGDTEVALAAFGQWGSDAVSKFIGMFAIALWDEQNRTLELFRDRVGVKPLYYRWDPDSFCFGSELKALRAFRHWTAGIDFQSLGEFLQYGYVPEHRSIYSGVFKLLPGHRLRLRMGEQPVIERYWSVLDALDEPLQGDSRELEQQLETLLIDACGYRMVSDVPVGVYLSGGVDSSIVTALLAKHHDQPISTFTIGFSERSHDESRWARRVAEHCGTNHTEYILEPREALDIARDWGSLFDEPFADSSSIPTLLVSRLASKDVKVVLSADGGDELFSGYNAYASVLERLDLLARVPRWLQSASRNGLALLPPARVERLLGGTFVGAPTRGAIVRRARRLRKTLDDPTPRGVIDVGMSHWFPDQIKELLGRYEDPAATRPAYPGDAALQLSLRDFHHYLPGDILTKVDRTTMAVSIEGREPLLDHRLAEFAFRLPPHLRRGSLGPKHLLKSILYRYVPRHLVDRPKQGFAIPKKQWLHGELKELVTDFLSPGRIREAGIMDSRAVERVVSDFYAGNALLSEPVWCLLTFEMWREQWQ